MKKKFPLVVKITLISVYLIFLAGAVVRMTGSGMGCPDWPKCFGYYIPPTSEEQITWQPNSKFNKYHTWTEYINRLTSVLSGFVFLFLVIGAFNFRKNNKWIPILAFTALLLMIFEGWLGKTVVDTNLKPQIITIHMVVALVIVGLLLKLLFIVSKKKQLYTFHPLFNKLLIISVVFSLIQIAMGTQVRQFIDEQVKLYGFDNKEFSLLKPNFKFYFHRSFTIAIVLVNFGMFYLNQIKNLGYKLVNWIVFLIFLETMTGILMYYADFPLGTQATHLLAGAILFGLQFYLWLQSKKSSLN